MATATLNEDAACALMLGETRARANGHHTMIGAEYILYGVLAHIEQESVKLWLHTPYGFVTAEMVMSRIVLLPKYSKDPSEGTWRCECYERTLMVAIELSEQDGSDFVELKHLLLAIIKEDEEQGDELQEGEFREVSLALSILKRLKPLQELDTFRRQFL